MGDSIFRLCLESHPLSLLEKPETNYRVILRDAKTALEISRRGMGSADEGKLLISISVRAFAERVSAPSFFQPLWGNEIFLTSTASLIQHSQTQRQTLTRSQTQANLPPGE